MYGKIPCKKLKYSSQKVKYSSHPPGSVPSNDEYIPVPNKVALDSLVEFSPQELNSCHHVTAILTRPGTGRAAGQGALTPTP